MHKKIAIGFAAMLASGAMAQDAGNLKIYGFMDVNMAKDDYKDNNFLVAQGYVNSNTSVYLNHFNTYFDWKANEKVRVLAEVSYNRDANQKLASGSRVHPDSVAIYNSLEAQLGNATRTGFSQYLQSLGLDAATAKAKAAQLTSDTLAKSTAAIAASIRSNAKQGDPSSSSKDHGISIPRVHADLLLNDYVNLRVGKWITPSGIWNVDHGSPIILTINQPNQTAFLPIFPESQTGIQAFGRTNVEDHDFSYNAWVSTGRGSDVLGQDDYAQMPQDLGDWAVGTHLQADLALGDAALRLGTTVHTGTLRGVSAWTDIAIVGVNAATETPYTGGLETAVNSFETDYYMREWIYGLDTKLKWKGLILQGEWNHRKVLNLQKDGNPETDFNAYYALAGYEIPLSAQYNVTPYVMHERISWENAANTPALGLSSFPMDGWSIYMLGLNFGLWGNVHIKTEWSHNLIDVVHNNDKSSKYYNNMNSDDLTIERYAAQLSVSF